MRRTAIAVTVAVAATFAIAVVTEARTRYEAETSREATVASAPLDDATIVAIFDAANTADIETGQLAAERGASKAVREFGAMLVRDHQQVRQQGRDLAARL